MRLRAGAASLLLAAVASSSSCVFPNLSHVEHVHDVVRVQVGHDTRDQVRALLGAPPVVDTPELYVYDWEKSKALFVMFAGYGGVVEPMGFTGTRALIVFDDDGRVARVEVKGAGQSDASDASDATASVEKLPRAGATPAPQGACAHGQAVGAYYAGPESRLAIGFSREIRLCDELGEKEVGRLAGRFYGFAISQDGRLAATYNRDQVLMLRDGSALEPLRELDPASQKGKPSPFGEGSALAFSSDGGRLLASFPTLGTVVYDTATGEAVLRRSESRAALLSPDGRGLLSWKARAGFTLTEVDTGHDIFVRPPPAKPWGGGSAAFSMDGRRLAVASCAHAEVWDLDAMTSSGGTKGLKEAFLLPFSKMLGTCRSWSAFSSDGGTLAVATEGTVTLYDLAAHRIRASYGMAWPVAGVAFTSDLTRAAFITTMTWVHGEVALNIVMWEVGNVEKAADSSAADRP